jgi:hypothetical protein
MKNVGGVAFKLNEEDYIPIGFKWVDCHLVFDVKMDLK